MLVQHKPNPDASLMRKYDIKIFVYGHTHTRKYLDEFGIITINPGAISFARDQYDYSFAIVDISKSKVDVTFHTLDEIIASK